MANTKAEIQDFLDAARLCLERIEQLGHREESRAALSDAERQAKHQRIIAMECRMAVPAPGELLITPDRA